MQYGFVIPGGEVRDFPEFAIAAEQAGWDAIFVADAIAIDFSGKPLPWFDPWVALAAMATATERIRLGTFITALPRRRPWKLARETATLDHLSNGRVILAVGLGAAEDDGGFCKVGEPMDLKVRAQLLDEGLEVIAGLWSGKRFSFKGEHYSVDKMAMLPPPVQQPRIPVWVVGVYPKEKSMRRALRWDGLIPQPYQATPGSTMTAEEVRAVSNYVNEHRAETGKPFDIIFGGTTPGNNHKRAAQMVRPYSEAGATWWLENLWVGEKAKVLKRINQGPPQV